MDNGSIGAHVRRLCPEPDQKSAGRGEERFRAARALQEIIAEEPGTMAPYLDRLAERLQSEIYSVIREKIVELIASIDTPASREILYQAAISDPEIADRALRALLRGIKQERDHRGLHCNDKLFSFVSEYHVSRRQRAQAES